ncbi:MAG: hypothetical protein AAFX94_03770 [Myxococcota bacterium]
MEYELERRTHDDSERQDVSLASAFVIVVQYVLIALAIPQDN